MEHPEPAARERTWDLVLLGLGLASVGVSLLVRVLHRGPYYPGWDLMAATEGHYLLSTRPTWEAVRELFYQNRHFFLPFSTFSAPFALIPGALTRLWPWQYWPHLVTLLATVATGWMILRAAGLRARQGGVVLLAWGSSPVLLSYAVFGYPWGSFFLAHAAALWITLSPRMRQRWFVTLLACLLVNELSWHVYELGKTVFVVFLAAAVLCRSVPLMTRVVWVVAAALQLTEVVYIHPTANVKAFLFQQGSPWKGSHVDVGAVVQALGIVARRLFIALDLDLPILTVAGVVSLLLLRRERLYLLALLLGQLALVVLVLTYGFEQLQPRRYLMVEGYCLVAVACLYREADPRVRRALIGLLLVGNLWQGVDLYRFVRKPLPPFTMPFTHSMDGVGGVPFTEVDFATELIGRVKAGERLLLAWNFDCFPENFTNPVGVVERLYLALGHERFVRSVFVFGSQPCRYCCLPIRPLSELGPFLDGVRPDGPTPPDGLVLYYAESCKPPGGKRSRELDEQLIEVLKRLRLRKESPPGARFLRFAIEGPVKAS